MFWRLKGRSKTEEGLKKTRQGWFGRLTRLLSGPRIDAATWEEMEEILIGADVGVATTQKLLEMVRAKEEVRRAGQPQAVLGLLKEEMVSILDLPRDALRPYLGMEPLPRPFVILITGVNGAGKTTSMAKLAHYFQRQGKSVLFGAADTFRAAAREQLQVWGQRLGIDVVAHQQGSDPGAVAHDAFQSARARGSDVLILDTAGRLHTKGNLMEELRKVHRVISRLDSQAPHQVLLVLDATTGYNGLAQAQAFTEAVGCHGVFLAKLDGTAKGGIVLAIARELRLPVLFIGTGEGAEDMAVFDPLEFVEALFTPAQVEGPA